MDATNGPEILPAIGGEVREVSGFGGVAKKVSGKNGI